MTYCKYCGTKLRELEIPPWRQTVRFNEHTGQPLRPTEWRCPNEACQEGCWMRFGEHDYGWHALNKSCRRCGAK